MDAWTLFLAKEKQRAARRPLAYLGVGRVSAVASEELGRGCRRVGSGHIKDLLGEALGSCASAPGADFPHYASYADILELVCNILASIDLTFGLAGAAPTPGVVKQPLADGAAAALRKFSAPSMRAFALCLPAQLRVIEGAVQVLWAMLVDPGVPARCAVCDESRGIPSRLEDGMWTLHCPPCHALLLESLDSL